MADSPALLHDIQWNVLDGVVERRSHHGPYTIDSLSGLPMNPVGRTGISNRGLLGRYGPNHAADLIATRWRRTNGEIAVDILGRGILEFVSVQRKDTGQWAIPGGMVEPGDNISFTLKKEFGEEALSVLEVTAEERVLIKNNLDVLFHDGSVLVYRGYVDDPRNTDNAWIETVAVHVHDASGYYYYSVLFGLMGFFILVN